MSLWLVLLVHEAPLRSPPSLLPHVAQSVADCSAPAYGSDQFACSDAELVALDRQRAALLPFPGSLAMSGIDPQEDWFRWEPDVRDARCGAATRSGWRFRTPDWTAGRHLPRPPVHRIWTCTGLTDRCFAARSRSRNATGCEG